jgi:uncharacterized protein YbjT (DUF2867 family)
MRKTFLVIGGTGMLGQPVARHLLGAGHRVRVFARHPERAGGLLAGCELVGGDVENPASLARALEGCTGVHLSLDGAGDWDLERRGAEAVTALAPRAGVQRLSLISGASTCEENARFPMVRAKLAAEQALRRSGVSFTIFRCSMFMETLRRFVRDDRAMILGRQPHRWRWLAADDYAAMVVRALERPEAANRLFHLRGPRALTMDEALETYRRLCAPQARLVHVPFWAARIVSFLPGGRELRRVGLPLMRYFAAAPERGDPAEADALLGAPATTLEAWCQAQAAPVPGVGTEPQPLVSAAGLGVRR